jgi:hypothetical protein
MSPSTYTKTTSPIRMVIAVLGRKVKEWALKRHILTQNFESQRLNSLSRLPLPSKKERELQYIMNKYARVAQIYF